MSKKIFICSDGHGTHTTGDTLEEAWEQFQDELGGAFNDATFYEATQMEVCIKIHRKEVPVKVIGKPVKE